MRRARSGHRVDVDGRAQRDTKQARQHLCPLDEGRLREQLLDEAAVPAADTRREQPEVVSAVDEAWLDDAGILAELSHHGLLGGLLPLEVGPEEAGQPALGRNHLRANAHVGHALRSNHLRRRGRLGVRDAIAEEQSLLVHADRADTRDHGIGRSDGLLQFLARAAGELVLDPRYLLRPVLAFAPLGHLARPRDRHDLNRGRGGRKRMAHATADKPRSTQNGHLQCGCR
mmetsp:Transcript_26397/g.67021  ORF Transcript_26397/g.67021 Transcript_26397/m.67021 type:complete len:229 (+) Transcript_26397:170-856(+)